MYSNLLRINDYESIELIRRFEINRFNKLLFNRNFSNFKKYIIRNWDQLKSKFLIKLNRVEDNKMFFR